jgi:hypothetical protein
VIGLQVASWPVVDPVGRVLFPEDVLGELPVHADALRSVLVEYLRLDRPMHVGDVYAMNVQFPDDPVEEPLEGPDLFRLITGPVRDITVEARLAAKTAYFSALLPPLDAELDARLVQELGTGDDEGNDS